MLKEQPMNEEKLRMLPDVPKDPISGKKPTSTQLKVVLLLNPIGEHPRTHAEVAKIRGVTKSAIDEVMICFKKRCPTFYQRFTEAKRSVTTEQTKTGWDEMNHQLLSLDMVAENQSELYDCSEKESLGNFLHDHLKEKF